MSDLSRFVANKLNGEWSASNVSGVLTDVIIEYLVSGEKWESLDPLVRSRLLLAPLFMRKRDLAELRPVLAKLAAAGAADKDEWVRAMAQSVGDYDGRLHNDRLLAGSKLVGKTVAGLQPLLDTADTRLFRPLEEVYMNKDLLQKLRGSSAAQGGAQQPAAAALPTAAKPHHHFRLRPASEAPSQRHPSGSAAAASRPAAQAPAAAAVPQAGLARGASLAARPVGTSGLASRGLAPSAGGAASAAARARQPGGADLDSMFLPRKPSLQRPAGLGGRGRGAAAPPVRRAATLDVEAAKNLAQQMQAERAKAEQAAREAAEAEARAKAEARAAERAVREAEKEVEAKRRAAEKAAAKEAARAEKEAARAAAKAAKDDGKEDREKAKAARAEAAAAKAAAKAAGQQRKRSASEREEPSAKRSATSGSEGQQRAAALPTPEAAAEALGEAALAAAADAAGMQLGKPGGRPDVEAMQAYLAAAYGTGQLGASGGDGEEEHI